MAVRITRKLGFSLGVLATVACLMVGLYLYFIYSPSLPPPQLGTAVQHSTIRVGELDRTYSFFVPEGVPERSPLLLVLHGSTQNAEDIRIFTGYEFERLAAANGFLVVYPEGYAKNWNDCRRLAPYDARALGVDDVAFLRALISRFHRDYGADITRVFAVGYSSGGHMVYRMALESPSDLTAVAAISASLPTQDNTDCQEVGHPIPILIMNGTADRINPFEGGEVSFFGFRSRGTVRSSLDTALYFAQLAEHGIDSGDLKGGENQTSAKLNYIERQVWQRAGKAEVALYSIVGGGHVIPQPHYRAPRFLGRTITALNGPEEIWKFFARQRSKYLVENEVSGSLTKRRNSTKKAD